MRYEVRHPVREPAGAGPGRAAHDGEGRYRAFFEHSPNSIVVTDGRRILLANPAAVALLRAASAADVIGLDPLRFVHPDSLPLVKERVAALCATPGTSVPFIDLKYLDLAGGVIEVESGARSFVEDGEIHILIETRDIARRMRAERALEGSELALWDTDLRTGKVFLSEGWARLLGEPAGETRTTVSELGRLVPPEELPVLEKLSRDVAKGLREAYSIEHRVRTRSGEWKWIVSAGKVGERDAAGRPLRMTGTNRDITERKRAELALQSARDRLERMNVELDARVRLRTAELEALVTDLETFHYAVEHDLRTSLGVMSVNAGMLLSDLRETLPAKSRRVLVEISGNAQLAATLLDDLLEYVRLGSAALDRNPVAMGSLVTSAWRELRRTESGRQLSLEAGNLPDAVGDQRMLAQLWQKLLSNAIKFTRQRERASIEVGYSREQAAYFVRDNGIGFDVQRAGKLFGLFARLHRDEGFEGNGVGLALAARIVRRHGGRIWAEAHPSAGATFWFLIPDKIGAKAEA